MSDKWNPGIISRFLQIYFQGRILSLFIHHSSIYFQYTPIDSDGKRGFSMEWAKVSLWHLSSNGVTKTIYFFLVDISDIHSVSDHSILKYEALSYHGRSLRALGDYLLLYFPSNENKSMFSLAFKIQEFRWYFRHAGRNNYEFYLVTDVRLERTERHSLESLIHFTKKRLCRLCIQ